MTSDAYATADNLSSVELDRYFCFERLGCNRQRWRVYRSEGESENVRVEQPPKKQVLYLYVMETLLFIALILNTLAIWDK